MGLRKIQMTIVTEIIAKQLKFKKRRTCLFKKANQLATLCGTEVAIVVFSRGGKAFSYGHPTVEYVIDRVLPQENPRATTSSSRRTRSTRRTRAAAAAAKTEIAAQLQAESVTAKMTEELELATPTKEIALQSEAETLTAELNQLRLDLEQEKDRGDALGKDIRQDRAKVGEVGELGLRDLERMEKSLKELLHAICKGKSEVDASLGLRMLAAGEAPSE